jgi:hypothetical protein
MGTTDLTQGAVTTGLVSENDHGKRIFIQRTRDFGVAANSVSNAEVLQMVPIPAGFMVEGVLLETQTVENITSAPCTLGDGNDVDGYLTTAFCNLITTATNVCNSTSVYAVENGGKGKFYPAADTIDLIPTNTLNAAKVRIGVWGFHADPGDSIAQ